MSRISSVRPAPISPLTPKISPARTSNDTSRTTLPRVMPSTFSATSPMRRSPSSIRSPMSRPTISVTSRSLVRFAHRADVDQAPVAQHRRALRDALQLLQPVRDIDERHAARLQPLDLLEQQVDFAGGEHRGRFVEDQHAAIVDQVARDLDHLLMPDPERADGRIGIDRVQPDLRHRVTRVLAQRAPVDPAESAAPFCGRRFRNRFSATDSVGSRFSSCITMRTPSASASLRLAGAYGAPASVIVPVVGVDQPADDLRQRALARAVLARQREHLARVQVERDVREHRLDIRLADAGDGQHARRVQTTGFVVRDGRLGWFRHPVPGVSEPRIGGAAPCSARETGAGRCLRPVVRASRDSRSSLGYRHGFRKL